VLEVFPDALFGVDISDRKSFLDRFVNDGRNVGFLSFHKYDAWGLGYIIRKGIILMMRF